MADLTVDVPWDSYISGEGKTEVGNNANRFDEWRQSGTLGPYVDSPESGPPETGGGAESAS